MTNKLGRWLCLMSMLMLGSVALAQKTGKDKLAKRCTEQTRCSALLFCPAVVEGVEVTALVDTGSDPSAADTTFFNSLEPRHKESVRDAKLVAADNSLTNIVRSSLNVEFLDIPDCRVDAVVFDLTKSMKHEWNLSCEFVAGVDLLGTSPIRINGGRSISRVEREFLDTTSPTVVLQRSSGNRVPYLLADAGAVEIRLMIDTGAMSAMMLTQSTINQLKQSNAIQLYPELSGPIIMADGRSVASEAYWLREIKIGPTVFKNVPVYVSGTNSIGMPIIRHFDLTMDLPTHRLWLDPLPSAATASFAPGGTGFSFQFDGEGRMKVLSPMRPDGPAERAGLKSGDEIVEIDGKPVSDFTYYTATDRFSQAGTTLSLKCSREGRLFDATMELKHRVAYPPEWPEPLQEDDSSRLFEEFEKNRR